MNILIILGLIIAFVSIITLFIFAIYYNSLYLNEKRNCEYFKNKILQLENMIDGKMSGISGYSGVKK